MRVALLRAVAMAAIMGGAGSLTAWAQVPGQPFVNPYKPYAVPNVQQAAAPVVLQARVIGQVPGLANIRVQTAVAVPDGGTVTLASYSQMSEGRNELGVPMLSRIPYLGRGFRNVGYGRSGFNVRLTASVRIIDLAEEEFRQTGVKSR